MTTTVQEASKKPSPARSLGMMSMSVSLILALGILLGQATKTAALEPMRAKPHVNDSAFSSLADKLVAVETRNLKDAFRKVNNGGGAIQEENVAVQTTTREEYLRDESTSFIDAGKHKETKGAEDEAVMTIGEEFYEDAAPPQGGEPKPNRDEYYREQAAIEAENAATRNEQTGNLEPSRKRKKRTKQTTVSDSQVSSASTTLPPTAEPTAFVASRGEASQSKNAGTKGTYGTKGKGAKGAFSKGKGTPPPQLECIPLDQTTAPTNAAKGKGIWTGKGKGKSSGSKGKSGMSKAMMKKKKIKIKIESEDKMPESNPKYSMMKKKKKKIPGPPPAMADPKTKKKKKKKNKNRLLRESTTANVEGRKDPELPTFDLETLVGGLLGERDSKRRLGSMGKKKKKKKKIGTYKKIFSSSSKGSSMGKMSSKGKGKGGKGKGKGNTAAPVRLHLREASCKYSPISYTIFLNCSHSSVQKLRACNRPL